MEDKLLLATLLIHDAIDLSSPSLSLTCATLPRLVGEVEGDLERLEDAKRSRWGDSSEERKAEEEKEKQRKLLEATGIKNFEESSGISILKWRGLEVTRELSNSENSKVIVIGTDENLPIILNGETPD